MTNTCQRPPGPPWKPHWWPPCIPCSPDCSKYSPGQNIWLIYLSAFYINCFGGLKSLYYMSITLYCMIILHEYYSAGWKLHPPVLLISHIKAGWYQTLVGNIKGWVGKIKHHQVGKIKANIKHHKVDWETLSNIINAPMFSEEILVEGVMPNGSTKP